MWDILFLAGGEKKGVKLQKSFVNVKSADRDTLLNRKVLQRNAGLEWCVRVRVKESSPQANVQIQAKQEKMLILQSAATSVDRSDDTEMQLADTLLDQ